ncbi:unnamed protein product [Brassicogethes aeneus]|uniref:Uncharacterized protein n=1 Tax=Brassicogethes aeneus TaxID=1431903 RepID=A0A9P0FP40_BRAAE|nr:unnamed protein product [Brassicogethes aeneus]
MQKVSYMTTINASPTNKSVIIETMKQALQVADECGQEYIQLTYDLAITKIALQIQSLERPRFDRLFIHFGAFHIDLAYFKAVGKYIENCGITNIMIDSGIIAGGSLSGFISGKHYNRCKRMHTILSLVLQILNWQQFLKTYNIEVSEGSEIYRALSQIRQLSPGHANSLEEEIRANGIGVRRTPKPHSTQPIDLILEETINLDAANSMTGISHITNSIAARQRWCKSHSFRTSVISNMMQDLSLRRKQDVSGDLKESSIKKSHSQIEKLLVAIEENVNPFNPDVPKKSLFNISSGEAVSDLIYESLVNVEKQEMRCAKNSLRNVAPIKPDSRNQ